MNRASRIGNLALAAFALMAWTARADAATATATISEASAEVGRPVQYVITVTGDSDEKPKPPEIPGLNVLRTAEQSTSHFSFGTGGSNSGSSTSYIFVLAGTHAGRFVIPSQDLHVSGSTVRVNPVTFTVLPDGNAGPAPGANGDDRTEETRQYFALLEVKPKSLYVGQAAALELWQCFAPDVGATVRPNGVLNGDGFTAGRLDAPREGVREFNGTQYRAFTYRTTVTAVKTGTVTIGPAEYAASVQVAVPRMRRRAFADPFDQMRYLQQLGQNFPQPVKLSAPPISVEVKPLPKGAPADFAGAIGQFTIDARADSQKVKAGEPVTVHVRVGGTGNFDRVQAPKLKSEEGLQVYPATGKFDKDDDVGLSGSKTFDQVITPQKAGDTLPGYHFSYFDPESGRYISFETPPIPLKVEGSVAAAPAPAPAPAAASATPTPKPEAARDILYLKPDEGTLVDADAFRPLYLRRAFWIAQGAPAAALLLLIAGLALGRKREDGKREAARRRAEWERIVRNPNAPRADFYGAAARLAELKANGRQSPALDQIFRRRDELTYSGANVAREPVPNDERSEVLATLNQP